MYRLNEKLKMLLLRRGITQRQVAFATGVDEASLSKLIRYDMGSSDIKERIAAYFKMDQVELFGGGRVNDQ